MGCLLITIKIGGLMEQIPTSSYGGRCRYFVGIKIGGLHAETLLGGRSRCRKFMTFINKIMLFWDKYRHLPMEEGVGIFGHNKYN